MQIEGVRRYDPSAASAPPVKEEMGKDAFLKLLVTQLQNQDPLNPTDNTEFVAQLAQFSSLEGITNMQKSMDGMTEGISSMQDYAAASLIGRGIKAEGDAFGYSGEPVGVVFGLAGRAERVDVTIHDRNGRLVRKMELGSMPSGENAAVWDGMDANGLKAPPGQYYYAVSARDANNNTTGVTKFVTGVVSALDFTGRNAELMVGGAVIPRKNIREIF